MDILFWSGGKDAYLALEFYRQEQQGDSGLTLLTTYEEDSGIVPHQNIPMKEIRQQAEHLDLSLLEVPLPSDCPNDRYLQQVEQVLNEQEQVGRLVFGDWKLTDVREWREEQFGALGYTCIFPIWGKSLHELLPVLMLKPVRVTISAVAEPYRSYIAVGETYDQGFVRTLPRDIDPMGENGEFHTRVEFIDLKERVV